MRICTDKTNFTPSEAGSFFSISSGEETQRAVIMLHGWGCSAERMEPYARQVAQGLPNTQVIIPNGTFDAFHNERNDRPVKKAGERFQWGDHKHGATYPYQLRRIMETIPEPMPVHLFGFSNGGYTSQYQHSWWRDRLSSTALHGSLLQTEATDNMLEAAQKHEDFKNNPLYISLPFFDPFKAFNESPTASKIMSSKIWPNIVSGMAGHHEELQEHRANTQRLRDAGFIVIEEQSPFAAHNINRDITKNYARFIEAAEGIPPAELILSTPAPP